MNARPGRSTTDAGSPPSSDGEVPGVDRRPCRGEEAVPRVEVPVGGAVGGVAGPRGTVERHAVQAGHRCRVDAGHVAGGVLRAVDGLRPGELLGSRAELADEARATSRCAAQLNPLTPCTTVGSVAASVFVTTPGFQMRDVRAAGPDRRRPREDLVARVRVHGEQRPPLDLGVPRRPVRVGPPLERRTARGGVIGIVGVTGVVARGVRAAHLREQVAASRRDGGHGGAAEREHADEQAEHEATEHRG